MARQLLILLLWALGVAASRAAEPPLVAAAADLKFALTTLAEDYTSRAGQPVKLAFGSSGTFAMQIEQGAPVELFLSADEDYVLALANKGLTRDAGRLYAIGRIALFIPHDSALAGDDAFARLVAAVRDGRLRRFAIANPAHAPYGRAAREALMHLGLWAALEPHLVLGENAAQAMQFASSGASDGGMVPLSLAMAPALAPLGRFERVPEAWHAGQPLRQRMALTRRAGPVATDFYAYLASPEARAVFERFGFTLPLDAAR